MLARTTPDLMRPFLTHGKGQRRRDAVRPLLRPGRSFAFTSLGRDSLVVSERLGLELGALLAILEPCVIRTAASTVLRSAFAGRGSDRLMRTLVTAAICYTEAECYV
jgi:hypothetical protein